MVRTTVREKVMPKHSPKPSDALGFQRRFVWHGEEISDILAWCRSRGERMVVIGFRKRQPNVLGSQMIETEEIYEMPESFWNCLGIDLNKDGIPREIRRYSP